MHPIDIHGILARSIRETDLTRANSPVKVGFTYKTWEIKSKGNLLGGERWILELAAPQGIMGEFQATRGTMSTYGNTIAVTTTAPPNARG